MNKAHLVVSQNFVFQNRASRSTRAHLHTFCRRCQRVPVVVPDGIVCHANKKRRRRRKKRSCCRPQHVVLPIKGFHRNPPQWVEGMPVFVSVPRPVPLSNQPATQALRELDNSLRSGLFFIQQAMPPGNRAQPGHGSQWRSDCRS